MWIHITQRVLKSGAVLGFLMLLFLGFTGGNGWPQFAFYGVALTVLVVGGYFRWRVADAARRVKVECLGCGYPRRGLAAGAVCPECGLGQGERARKTG